MNQWLWLALGIAAALLAFAAAKVEPIVHRWYYLRKLQRERDNRNAAKLMVYWEE